MGPGAGILALPDQQPHPSATKVLVNWLLSAEGQTIFSQGFGSPAARFGVPTTGISPTALPVPGEKLYWTDEDIVLSGPKIQQLSREIFSALMK